MSDQPSTADKQIKRRRMPQGRKRSVLTEEKVMLIQDAYYDPETGYVGADRIYRHVRDKGVTLAQVKEVLGQQKSQQQTVPNEMTTSFVPRYPSQSLQVDLIFLQDNRLNSASYGVVAVNPFTKQADIRLIKKKEASHVVPAMKKLLESLGTPDMLYTDEGAEFVSLAFKKLMDDRKIQHVFSLTHATMVERFNRTIKTMMSKYQIGTGTKTISAVLPKLLKNYNSTPHSALGGLAPNEVTESQENIEHAHLSIYKSSRLRRKRRIRQGDMVLVRKKRKGFVKGYWPAFLDDPLKVEKVEKVGQVRYYHIEGLNRRYLRAEIRLAPAGGKSALSTRAPEYAGTLEARLKERGEKLPHNRSSVRQKEVREQGIEDALPGDKRLKPTPAQSTRSRKRKQKEPWVDNTKIDRANILQGKRRRG